MTDLELYFRYRCKKGLVEKSLHKKKEYVDRLEHEIKIITDMHFCGYFLIVSDIVTWAISNGILVGYGRGSASGSLASYVLKITHLDPIKYNLIFARFIDPERKGSRPDIDLDFEEGRRHEVFQYVTNKYGSEYVSNIGTYGTMKAKAAIRDVARTLGFPYELGDKLAQLTLDPVAGKPQPLSVCYEKVKELHDYRFGPDSKEKKILQIAERFENRIRSVGVHAAGFIISNIPISSIVPLFKGKEGQAVTQFEMNTVEKVGLIKFDFLGLKALSTINHCLNLINEIYGIKIDQFQIPIDDPEIYELLRKGDGICIFQLESSQSMRDLLVRIKPEKLEDISVLLAVFRPGPLCVSGDTKILKRMKKVKKGKSHSLSSEYITIKELYEKYIDQEKNWWNRNSMFCQSVDLLQGVHSAKFIKNKIKAVYNSGKKDVYKIKILLSFYKTHQNYKIGNKQPKRKTDYIESSLDHMFLTVNGEWKRLENIKIGDYIAIYHHSGFGRKLSKKRVEGFKNFQNIALRNWQYRCVFCDWDGGKLDVNHIYNNRFYDNSADNLCWLCPNHHRMYSEGTITKEQLLKEREQYRLPYTKNLMFVKYLGLEYAGVKETYDIEMEAPHHNFIAGDFIVHNSLPALQDYLKVRAGIEKPKYLIPQLEPILKETDSLIVYQESIMQICRQLANYSMADSYALIKCVGKKKLDELAKHKDKFISGCIENNIQENKATELFEQILGFADYCFNKCLHGDTLVYVKIDNNIHISLSIKELYNLQSVLKRKLGVDQLEILAMKENGHLKTISFQPIKNIYWNRDKKLCYKLKLNNGMECICSQDHKFLTHNGYIPVKNMVVNKTNLYVNIDLLPNFSNEYAVGSARLISLSCIGFINDTYDIEMDTLEHNFIANGIVSSNSHSISYAHLTCQMAWLKSNYPVELLCSCLTSDSGEVDKVIAYINDCKEHGIQVLPPSINKSDYSFTVDNKAIRFGLGAIKNIGEPIKDVIEERKENGVFKNLKDFTSRINLSKINKKRIESLILCGALDDFGTRMSLLIELDNIFTYKDEYERYESKKETYQKRLDRYLEREEEIEKWNSLSKEERKGIKKPTSIKKPEEIEEPKRLNTKSMIEMLDNDKLRHEKELLGFFISGHPLDNLKLKTQYTISSLKEAVENNEIHNKSKIKIIAIPSIINQITTKKKQKMAYLILEDRTGTIQATILPKKYEQYKNLLDIFTPCIYEALVESPNSESDNIIKLMIHSVQKLNFQTKEKVISLLIPLDNSKSFKLLKTLTDGTQDNSIHLYTKGVDQTIYDLGLIQTNSSNLIIKRMFSEYLWDPC